MLAQLKTVVLIKEAIQQRKLVLTRIERVGGPGAQLSKRTRTLECLD